ncbi:MFS family permease [Deinobacterium chartae]|uniref:MFS family permease n=1 Tax=Deinobacterium chartae TaxID=521158 RepID=A0A841I6E2_9DEIO|nr:MFS transporter [Deinobacterium chartae]MBB6100048.1 MFS family permease [Deinobacterium chartae]
MQDAASRPVNPWLLSLFWFGSAFHWFILLPILIPADVVRFVGEASKGTYLGLMLGVSAVIPLVLPPIIGAYSDRVGKRLPFLVWGVVLNALGVLGMALAHTYWPFFLAFLLVQLGNNLATAPYSALIPELVPSERRGHASGAMGLLQLMGQALGGIAVLVTGLLVGAGVLPAAREAQYLLVGVVLIGSAAVTLLNVPEPPAAQRSAAPALRWTALFLHQAFLWVFLTRALFSLGQYSVQPFLQFYLGDVVAVPQPAEAVSYLLLALVAGGTVSALIGGRISDRVGRKPVIYVAGGLMAICALLFLFAPSFGVALAIGLLFGLGYGAFTSVDWALGADAMPSARSFARDMGIWHVAFVAPQLVSTPQGRLLDWGNSVAPNLGYTLIFGSAVVFFALGVILIRNVKGVR